MRRKVVVVALLIVVVGLTLSGFFGGPTDEPAAGEVPAESLIEIDGEHALWPYTSRTTTVEGRTLAINVVFHNDAETVENTLRAQPEREWEETDENESDAEADFPRRAVTADWEAAHGSTRYSYFEGPTGGVWVTETFELHDGAYLGARDHVRAYESPDGAYTAVQVHEEYYDWFRLRHTVTDIDEPAVRMENEFIAENANADVSRQHHGIEHGWSDGWLSVIELLVFLPLAGALLHGRAREETLEAAHRFRREMSRYDDAAILGAGLAAVYLGVRGAGIGLEVAYPDVAPKTIAAPLYLAIAVGLPAVVFAAADECEPTAAFLGAVIGLGTGFVLDFAGLGIAVPPDLIVHRTAMLAALGLVATGRASDDETVLVVGLLAWTVGLLLPLADVI